MSSTPDAAKAAPAGRRRFWVTVLCFALANLVLNLGAWVVYDHIVRSRRPALPAVLEVRQFLPGDGQAVEGKPTFSWSFNLDMAPPRPNAPAPGHITPAVAGKWSFDDPRRLTFVPDEPLPKATH